MLASIYKWPEGYDRVNDKIVPAKNVLYICDGKCSKAWGITHRPEVQLSDDVDDTVYIEDQELKIAPANPGCEEGGHLKPYGQDLPDDANAEHNKWCYRQCERMNVILDLTKTFYLKDFCQPVYNLKSRRDAAKLK